MTTNKKFAVITACALFFALAAAALAEDAAFPALKAGKKVKDDWYQTFAEGRKISYGNETVSEVTYDGKTCLLTESDEITQVTADGKKHSYEEIQKVLVEKDTFEPLFYTTTDTFENCTHTITAKVEKKDGMYSLTVTKTLNDKKDTETQNLPADDPVYFRANASDVYIAKHLKDKNDATIQVFDFDKMSTRERDFTYESEQAENGVTYQVITEEYMQLWVQPDNDIGKVVGANGQYVSMLTDKKTAQDFSATMPGPKHEPPADVVTIAQLGLKITRPGKTYSIMPDPKYGFLGISDITAPWSVDMLVQPVPQGVTIQDAFKHYNEREKGRLGEGKIVTIGSHQFMRGAYKDSDDIDARKGEYFITVVNGECVIMFACAMGDVYNGIAKDAEKVVESVEFIPPEYDKTALTYKEKNTGLSLTLPNPGWTMDVEKPNKDMLFSAENNWTKTYMFAEILPPEQGINADVLWQQVQGSPNAGRMRVGKFDAVWMEGLDRKAKVPTMVRRVFIFRTDDVIIVTILGPPETWNSVEADVNAITKSLDISE